MDYRQKALEAYNKKVLESELQQRNDLQRLFDEIFGVDAEDYSIYVTEPMVVRAKLKDFPEYSFNTDGTTLYIHYDGLVEKANWPFGLASFMPIPITSWGDLGHLLVLSKDIKEIAEEK